MRAYQRALQIEPPFGSGPTSAWANCWKARAKPTRPKRATARPSKTESIERPTLATLARFCRNRQWYEAAATNFDDAVAMNPADPALAAEAGEAHFLHGMELGEIPANPPWPPANFMRPRY